MSKFPNPLKLVIGVLLVLLVFPILAQVFGNAKAYLPKTGRIVDLETGKGMADTTVIAVATFYAPNPVEGSAHGTLYRIITHTDSDGDYSIPSTWSHVVFAFPALPGTTPKVTWIITAYKPGYAIVGDEVAWVFDEYGQASYFPRSTWFSPASTFQGVSVHVAPITMKTVDLSLKEAAVYAWRIASYGSALDARERPEEIALRENLNFRFMPLVCKLDPETKMDSTEAGALTTFARDYLKARSKLSELEPQGYRDLYMRPVFHASNVCAAMMAGENRP